MPHMSGLSGAGWSSALTKGQSVSFAHTQRRTSVAVLAALLAAIAAPASPALAAPSGQVDQQWTGAMSDATYLYNSQYLADIGTQGADVEYAVEITPSSSGTLTGVTSAFTLYRPDANAVLQGALVEDRSGPFGQTLATSQVTEAQVQSSPQGSETWTERHDVTFEFASPAPVTAGTHYWVVYTNITDTPTAFGIGGTSDAIAPMYYYYEKGAGTGSYNRNSKGWPSIILTDYIDSKAATTLTASSYISAAAEVGQGVAIKSASVQGYRAKLTATATGAPVAGRSVAFTSGSQTMCTAVTDTKGVAQCPLTTQPPGQSGYIASFAGDSTHFPSTGSAPLVG